MGKMSCSVEMLLKDQFGCFQMAKISECHLLLFYSKMGGGEEIAFVHVV